MSNENPTPEVEPVAESAPVVNTPSPVVPAPPEPVLPPVDPEAEIRRISRRSFLWAGTVLIGGIVGLNIFNKSAPGDDTGIKQFFRNGHRFNEGVARSIFFSPQHMAQEFPRDRAVEPRNNYKGATPEIDVAQWKLNVSGLADGDKTLTLDDLKDLPTKEQTTEFKCVEGWSAIVNWSGIPFAEFIKKYPPPAGTEYVALRSEPEGSEDEWYYVSLDMPSCLHPQSLLATHMNGKPLTTEHGAPLRLIMPHKYGIKNIKLITHIAYAKERPKDYWEERGYDWYAGL